MPRSFSLPLVIALPVCCAAQFGPQHFAFQSDVNYPAKLWFDDLNGDGHTDAIAWNFDRFMWWANDGTGQFGEKQDVLVQSTLNYSSFTSADVDMDGDRDLIGKDGWWANDGVGNFTFVNNIADHLIFAGIADVDDDGDPDVIGRTGVLNGNTLITFFGTVINDGLGNFTDGESLASDAGTTIQASDADFDGDGDLDLLLSNDAALVGFYPNLGAGLFGARVEIPGITGTMAASAGDVDGDGDIDLFTFGGTPATRWFANDGNATFAVADTMVGTLPAADHDGDGDLDLCSNTGTTCNVRLMRNDGTGAAWTEETVENFSGYNLVGTRYAWADIDEDGDLDLGIVHGLGMIAWYPNNGDGSFGLRQRIGHELSGGAGMAVVDLDGDGDNDIAAAGMYGDWITTYMNNGDGTFAQQEVVLEHLDQVSTCRAADLNGDGFAELLTNKAETAVLWNDGTGHFSAGTLPNNGVATLPGDLDGDFDLDLIGAGIWYRNEGNMLFTEVAEPQFAISGTGPGHVTDLNGDGIADVLCLGASIVALINDGTGVFTAVSSSATSGFSFSDVADMDLDGDVDLVALSGTVIHGYLNDGNGSFTGSQLTPGEVGTPRHLLVVDVSGDGYPDALWARSNLYDHKTFVNLNNGDGTLGSAFIVDPQAESTAMLAFADVNGDVVPDLVASRFHTITWQENHFFDAFRLRGNVFKDYDQNGIEDPTDDPLPYAPMRTAPAGLLAWTNTTGGFDFAVDSGVTYALWPGLPAMLEVTTVPDTAVVQANADEPVVDSLLFGLGPVLDTNIQSMSFTRTLLRCNTEGSFHLDVRNAGSTVLTDIHVGVALSPDFTFLGAYPAPDSVVSNTVYWAYDSLPWWGIKHFQVDVIAGPFGSDGMAYATAEFGSTAELLTDSAGLQTVTCSYDPNDKRVLPEGYGEHHAVPIDQDWLDYTIRFQNTGTDTAFNVLLIDRLSADLDWQSMEILGTSHPLTNIFIEEDGELNFRYDQILLPDSGANMAGSNGYVRFRIRPLPDRPNLTEIHNTAEIYFDHNAPVITNTTLTTLVDCDAFSASVTMLGADLLQASAGVSYQWYQDGQALPDATSQELFVDQSGYYSVEVTNAYGCVLLSEEVQVVLEAIPGTTGLNMAVIPNPMKDGARVVLSEALPVDAWIDLVDVNGRTVRTMNGNGQRWIMIDRGALPAGLYVLRVHGLSLGNAVARLVVD